ncbi:tetratricopeptide repeat protein [Roseomonas chloroacetimidivorans]|uniref:tetratricopeptide repeat protein n=1 Tax=Roseomonas chloroacetimidivorans TaxID=1766656 RepID=UPI003C73724F
MAVFGPEIVFDSDLLQAVYEPHGSKLLLITFAPFRFKLAPLDFWGKKFASNAKISILGFVAKTENWYPQSAMKAAIHASLPRIARYREVVTYGSSMGAYAALKYGAALNAGTAVAFAPQYSIDPDDGIQGSEFTMFFRRELHLGMRISPGDAPFNSFIFYDSALRFDDLSAKAIQQSNSGVKLIGLPSTGHECIRMFASTALTSNLLHLCVKRDEVEVRRLVRQVRSTSTVRMAGLARRLVSRDLDGAMELVHRGAGAFADRELGNFLNDASVAYLRRGDVNHARNIAMRAHALIPSRATYMRTLAAIELVAQRPGESLRWAEKALKQLPNDVGAMIAAARASIALQDRAAALRWTVAARGLAPNEGRLPAIMAQIESL